MNACETPLKLAALFCRVNLRPLSLELTSIVRLEPGAWYLVEAALLL